MQVAPTRCDPRQLEYEETKSRETCCGPWQDAFGQGHFVRGLCANHPVKDVGSIISMFHLGRERRVDWKRSP